MTSRIGTYAQNSFLTQLMMQNKQKIDDNSLALSSYNKYQTYGDMSNYVHRVLNLEDSWLQNTQFKSDNQFISNGLDLVRNNVDAFQSNTKNLLNRLLQFQEDGGVPNYEQVEPVQRFAYQMLNDMQSYLNMNILGEYQFAGSKNDVTPVNLHLGDSIEEFQKLFNGDTVSYPTSKDSNLSQFSATAQELHNWAVFDTSGTQGPTITDVTGSEAFRNLKPGQVIQINNTGNNNGSYTIKDVIDPNTILIETKFLVDEAGSSVTWEDPNPDSKQSGNIHNATLDFSYTNNSNPPIGDPQDGLIISQNSMEFKNYEVGDSIIIKGATNAENNKKWIVTGINKDANTLSVSQRIINDEGTATNPSFASTNVKFSFFQGGMNSSVSALSGTFLQSDGSPLPSGTRITFDNTGTLNDGRTFTVKTASYDGSSITFLDGEMASSEVGIGDANVQEVPATIKSLGYYNGNNDNATFQVDGSRHLSNITNASHPGFEKTIRALGIIAQGDLKNHPERLEQAIYLVNSALGYNTTNIQAPSGIDPENNIKVQDALENVVYLQRTIKTTNERLTTLINGHLAQLSDIEHTDILNTTTETQNLLNAQTASYNLVARLSGMSLLNYL